MLPNCDNSAARPTAKTLGPRIFETIKAEIALTAAAIDLNVEVANFLPQRVAVQAEQIGGADLIAAGRRQRGGQQRHLDFLKDAVVEPRRRYAVWEARKVRRQIGLDRAAKVLDAERRIAAGCDGRRRQLAVNHRTRDDVLRIERGKPPREVFELAHIAGPAVLL